MTELKTLETERLLIRPFVPSDAEDMQRRVYGDPEVARFYCGDPLTLEQVQERVVYWGIRAKRSEDGLAAVVLRDAPDRPIGIAGPQFYLADFLRLEGEPETPFSRLEVELSYAFGRDFHSQGYASEAGRAIIDYAFREMKIARLINVVDQENAPSVALMRRLGFRVVANLSPKGQDTVVGVLENDRLGG